MKTNHRVLSLWGLLALGVSACSGSQSNEQTTTSSDQSNADGGAGSSGEQTQASSGGAGDAGGTTSAQDASAGGAAVAYTESPTLQGVPDAPVAGQVAGQAFNGRYVRFEASQRSDGWEMLVADADVPAGGNPPIESHYFTLMLPREPSASATFQHAMTDSGGGYLQQQINGQWESDNTAVAWVVEVTAWNTHPVDPAGPLFQQIGTASGRVIAMFRGHDNVPNAYAAGTFHDAEVRAIRPAQRAPAGRGTGRRGH